MDGVSTFCFSPHFVHDTVPRWLLALMNRTTYKFSAFPASMFFLGKKKKGNTNSTGLCILHTFLQKQVVDSSVITEVSSPLPGPHPTMRGGDYGATLQLVPKPLIPGFSGCPLVSSDLFRTNHSIPTALFKVTLKPSMEKHLSRSLMLIYVEICDLLG